MKKILILTIACLTLSQAKMFVGVDGGYMWYGSASNGKTNSSIYNNNDKHRFDLNGWNVALNFGAESFANDYFGARAFLEAMYSRGINNNNNTLALNGNADILVNLVNTGNFAFGVFGGVGIGYEYDFRGRFGQGDAYAPLYGRAGLSFGLGDNSRIDGTVKMPIMGWHIHGSNKVNTLFSSLAVQVGYKYLF